VPRYLIKEVKALEQKGHRRPIAILDVSRCLAWETESCQICYLQCPKRDEAMVLHGSRPTVVASVCDGCGVCVEACRTVNTLGAIHLAEI
jgi:ferredoxin-type protein NapG